MSRFAKMNWVTLAVLVLVAGCGKKDNTEEQAATPAPMSTTVVDPNFQTPESVLHDAVADVYLVSNINGDPLGKDNNGFISRVGPDGRVLEPKWIAGGVNGVSLDAPKGSAIAGESLYVADIDVVRVFHRATGAPIATWAVPGAAFLNDVASGPDGTVYVTDTGFIATPEGFGESGTDALYRFGPNGEAIVVVKDPSLGRPNGIVVASDGIIVCTFGSGEVYRIDPATGARTDLPKPPMGQLDGVVLTGGGLLVSSWAGSAVYLLADNAYTTAVDSVMTPADIGYDAGRSVVLIPVFMGNKIEMREVH